MASSTGCPGYFVYVNECGTLLQSYKTDHEQAYGHWMNDLYVKNMILDIKWSLSFVDMMKQ